MATIANQNQSRRPLQRMLARAEARDDSFELNFRGSVDFTRHFVCPTATPLFYAPVYRELSSGALLRYNQLTAISFNELIAFFETTFAASVLSALRSNALEREDAEFARALVQFVAEEQRHTQWWRRLSRLSLGESVRPLFRVSRTTQAFLKQVTCRPRLFPAIFWIMLVLEERSIDISHRCLRMEPADIEPNYREVYRKHLEHEVGHVYLDGQLIDRYYAHRRGWVRRFNARLLRAAVAAFLLPPVRSAARVVQQLVRELPQLAPLQSLMLAQLKEVGARPEYHQMMYSREATPITFNLFDQFPEMHAMSRALKSYVPPAAGSQR